MRSKKFLGVALGCALLLAGTVTGIAMAQNQTGVAPTATVEQVTGPDDQVQEPSYSGSIAVDQAKYDGMSEAEEAAALQQYATVSAADAEAAVLAANPGTTVVKTELDDENGVLVFSVELSNGKDVKVDAGSGAILHMEAGESDAGGVSEGSEAAED
jgi:uncharacterized membrane protein YkoI